MRNLIDIRDLSTQEIDELIAVANDIIATPQKYADVCRGKSWQHCSLNPLRAHV